MNELQEAITVLPSRIQDELNKGSTPEECATALSDYVIEVQSREKDLEDKIKTLEKAIDDARYEAYSAPDMNMNNYSSSDVAKLNDAMIEVFRILDNVI